MADLIIKTPRDAGATRIRLLTPDGRSVDDLNTPHDDQMLLRDAGFGAYSAIVQPLGQAPKYFHFVFGPESGTINLDPFSGSASTAISSLGAQQAAAPGMEDHDTPIDYPALLHLEIPDSMNLAPAGTVDPLFFLGINPVAGRPSGLDQKTREFEAESKQQPEQRERGPDTAELVPVSEKLAPSSPRRTQQSVDDNRLQLGLSQDERPFDPGGWVPYAGPSPHIEPLEDGVSLTFERINKVLPEPRHARLRLSATIVGGPQYRMLVPLFDGGVRLVLRPRSDGSREIDVEVAPLDADRLSLTQALGSGFGTEAETILDQFTSRHHLTNYISHDAPADPWTAILGVLVGMRFSKLEISGPSLIAELADRYGWISDALVLEARRHILSSDNGSVAFDVGRRSALKSLIRARRVGAPYFFYSNSMASDILSALASRPDESSPSNDDKEFEARVVNERVRWQHFIRWQGQAGAFFTWRTHHRYSNAQSFDPRFMAILNPEN